MKNVLNLIELITNLRLMLCWCDLILVRVATVAIFGAVFNPSLMEICIFEVDIVDLWADSTFKDSVESA